MVSYIFSDKIDPDSDHIAIVINGIVNHSVYPHLPVVTIGNIEDDNEHLLEVFWSAYNKFITVKLDNITIIDEFNIDLFEIKGSNRAYVGFPSATGGRVNLHYFKVVEMLLVGLAPQIEIDGGVSDWDAVGIMPAYVDRLGDTQPWSRDPQIVGRGFTAEPPDKVEANDKCRDLKAVYFYADEDWIYIRLDVNLLYEGWCVPSQKYHEG